MWVSAVGGLHETDEKMIMNPDQYPHATGPSSLDLAPDAIFARDANGRIAFWNHGAEATYGYSAAEALGVAPRDLLQTESRWHSRRSSRSSR